MAKKIIIKIAKPTGSGGDEDAQVSNKLRSDWNDYIDWLERKGLRGHPSLDTQDNGGKMIDLYRKENPYTSVSRETIIPIQNEFQKYRNWSLDQIKQGKANLNLPKGATIDDYMKDLSIVDGIAGQRTTSFKFPETYLKTFDSSRNLQSTQNTGFATINSIKK